MGNVTRQSRIIFSTRKILPAI